jgi:hypothetical protein
VECQLADERLRLCHMPRPSWAAPRTHGRDLLPDRDHRCRRGSSSRARAQPGNRRCRPAGCRQLLARTGATLLQLGNFPSRHHLGSNRSNRLRRAADMVGASPPQLAELPVLLSIRSGHDFLEGMTASLLARLCFGLRSQGGHWRLAALLQRGTPSSGAQLPDAPADLRRAMPVDRGTAGCAERFRFPRFPSKIGKRGKAHRRPHTHRHQQQRGFGD